MEACAGRGFFAAGGFTAAGGVGCCSTATDSTAADSVGVGSGCFREGAAFAFVAVFGVVVFEFAIYYII